MAYFNPQSTLDLNITFERAARTYKGHIGQKMELRT